MESDFDCFCTAFGAKVRRLRQQRGWTQEQMEERGFSLRHYQRIEAGQSVTLRTVWKLAKAFGVPPASLFPRKKS